jgi:1A family penicillin-binding protein
MGPEFKIENLHEPESKVKKLWRKLVQFIRSRDYSKIAHYASIIRSKLIVWSILLWAFLKRRGWRKISKNLGTISLWFFVIGSILLFSYVIYVQRTLPDPEALATRQIGQSTKIYDSTGNVVLYDIHGEERRTVIPWEDIPETVKKVTLISEDKDFYNHKGIDITGIIRAFFNNIMSFEITGGGSTITQQLLKNAFFGTEQTYTRKIKEAILAVEIEKRFTKDEIFWMYLNQIPYGQNAYGIEAAAKTYFGKPARELTYGEAAALSAITKGTHYYSPYGNNYDAMIARKNGILKDMFDLGHLTEQEYNEAVNQELAFQENRDILLAPHFVIMVREYLISKFGEDAVQNKGYKVITTLDPKLQEIAEEVVKKYGAINKQKYRANNAALTAIDPKTGNILALVGSVDYFDIQNQGNFNVATAKRQPGSSFKPFAYATAFTKGFTDSTILFDVKTEFNPNCTSDGNSEKDRYGLACYNPNNYDLSFRGPVTMRQALQMSLNIPAVKTLYLAGINDTIRLASNLGITTLTEPERYGLSLVLGGAEVKLVDMVSAYSVFANDGIRNPWNFIKSIELPDGTVVEEYDQDPKRALEAQTARLISDVLSDNSARAPVFGVNNALHIPGIDIAAKTGTTQENKDAWVLGYTTSLAAGVWTGNNDNKPMTAAGGGISAAGPMWNEFMRRSLATYPPEEFKAPDPVYADKIMLNGSYSDGSGQYHTILHYVDRSNPAGSIPSDPYQDTQYNNWEAAVRRSYPQPDIFQTPTQ